MLSICAYLVLWHASQLVAAGSPLDQVRVDALRCGPSQLVAGSAFNDSYRVSLDSTVNAAWTSLVIAVLVSNRSTLDLGGYWPIHRLLIDEMDPRWAVQLHSEASENGRMLELHVSRDTADSRHASYFDFTVTITPDATGCYNASGPGLLTLVNFAASDTPLTRHAALSTAMCTHEQDARCVAYYVPLKKVRDVCKPCYGAFIVMAFIMLHLLSS